MYFKRLKNKYDRNVYCSPEDKEERFRKMLEAEERRRLKEEYEAERRKDELKGELYDIFGSKRNS